MKKFLLIIATSFVAIIFTTSCDGGGYYDDECHTCGHSTKSGGYCKRKVCDGHTYCYQHR